jgi:hypothetical protein
MSAGTIGRSGAPADGHDGTWTESEQDGLLTARLTTIVENRSVIEQVKGMLMFIYGIDADAAFEILRAQSQQHNVKLRVIAEQLSKDLVELSQSKSSLQRLKSDGVLMTAHRRIANSTPPRLEDGPTAAE